MFKIDFKHFIKCLKPIRPFKLNFISSLVVYNLNI